MSDSEVGELLAELADVRKETDARMESIELDVGDRYDQLLAHIVKIEGWVEDLSVAIGRLTEAGETRDEAIRTGSHEIEGMTKLVQQHGEEIAALNKLHAEEMKDQRRRDRTVTAIVTAIALVLQHLLAGGQIPGLGG